MGYNPSDIQFAIIKETTPGTIPASGALLKIDHVPGTSPMYASDALESPLLSSKRASAGTRKNNFRVEGGIATQLYRDAAIELLMQSALSGTWAEAGDSGEAGDILKASNVDTSFSVEKKVNGTSALYYRFKGCQVAKMTLACEASGNADLSFELLGMGRDTATSATSLTYTNASDAPKLSGIDVTNVTIAGLTGVQYRKLELNVEHQREAKDTFGSTSAVGIGTSGNRKVTLNLTFYRENFSPETVLASDDGVAVSFDIGDYTFTIPAAVAAIPQDEEDGSKYLVSVTFTAKRDNDDDTDFMITRN